MLIRVSVGVFTGERDFNSARQRRTLPADHESPNYANGAPSVVADPMQMLFGRLVDWCPGTTPLENIEVLKAWRLGAIDVAVRVEPETPFLFVVSLVQGE